MRNKFNAKRITTPDGVFDSKKEFEYYCKLKMMMKATNDPKEKVVEIRKQVRFDIDVNGKHIGFYKLDFAVTYADGRTEFVDVKGLKKGSAYQIFRLKKRLVEALYNIKIKEV